MSWREAVLLSALVGCSGSTSTDDDDDDNTLSFWDTGTEVDPDLPIVESGELICNPGTTSPDTLNAIVKANDPQGTDTLDPTGGALACYDSAGEVVFDDMLLVCSDSGDCTAGWTVTTYAGVDCDSAGTDYTFMATVMDEDGNVSLPVEIPYTGR